MARRRSKELFLPLDIDFFAHEKTIRAGDDAALLFIAAACWCRKFLRDGVVAVEVLPNLRPWTQRRLNAAVKALVGVGLWHEANGGYHIHDWTDWNPTAEEIEAKREAERRRKAAGKTPEHPPEDGRKAPGRRPDSSHERTEVEVEVEVEDNNDEREETTHDPPPDPAVVVVLEEILKPPDAQRLARKLDVDEARRKAAAARKARKPAAFLIAAIEGNWDINDPPTDNTYRPPRPSTQPDDWEHVCSACGATTDDPTADCPCEEDGAWLARVR